MMPTGMVIQRQGKYLNITFENSRQMVTVKCSDAMWIRWGTEIVERAENVSAKRSDTKGS